MKYFRNTIDLRKMRGLTDVTAEEIAKEAKISPWTLRNITRLFLVELKDFVVK